MSRTLVQFSLLTLLVFASVTGAFAQSSDNPRVGEVIGNNASSQMSVIKEPLSGPAAKSDPAVSRALAAHPSVYVTVMGQVRRPGVYEFRNGSPDLQELVEQAGNLTRFCGHEFFVFKANEDSFALDPEKDRDYRFEDGDILLAETSTRYYRALGTRNKAARLAEIHPVTQIVLLNVLDQPVFLSLSPEDAKLAHLLSLLNQDGSAMVGVERIEPPNASAIPADALIVPDIIFSGSIVRFVPGAVDRAKLPQLPVPVPVQTSSKVQMLSAQTVNSDSGWTGDPGTLMVKPVNSKNRNPFDPDVQLGPSDEMSRTAETESSGNPFDDVFAQFEESSAETLNSDAPEILLPAVEKTEERALLSAQQWRIIVTFVTLMTLFLTAWYIRQRQQQSGNKTLTFLESRIATSPAPGAVPAVVEEKPARSSHAAIADTPRAEPAHETAKTEATEPPTVQREHAALAQAAEAHDEVVELEGLKSEQGKEIEDLGEELPDVFEVSSYDSGRSEHFFDEYIYEVSIDELGSGHEIEVFDQVERPREAAADAAASIDDDLAEERAPAEAPQGEIHHVIEDLEPPASRVQQSILGTPWIQDVSTDLDPRESDVSLDEQPIDAPEAEAEVEEAKPQSSSKRTSAKLASQQLRIDPAHSFEPRPETRQGASASSSERHVDDAEPVSERNSRPSAAAQWMKMEDAPPQPEENLDHVFQAIMRERKK